ncbi:2401_t:CDS:10 [Diversispora eburnea]|uniref:2401_t:CDS:1 n=2 Tax=Diversisporales TaxID=214509 RepID=A0A9N8YP43_9GLOM|nr:2401_t:CDS:10 [Diversispora eburnea]
MTSFAYPMDASVLKRTAALPLSPKQYIYAGMESGYLYRIDIISERSIVFTLLHDEKFINPIGTGMTVLCLDPEIGDFIIFSGEMSDGAVSGPKSKSKITWEIPNWAPISDFQMLDLHKERRDVIFSCSGVAPYGSIRELRKAIGVNVITKTESDFNGINSLWNLKYNVNDIIDTFLAISFSNSTRLMRISECELDDVSDQISHIREVEKDYELNSGYLIQIHRKSIIVSKPNIISGLYLPITHITKFRWIPPDNSIIEVADVYDSIVIISLSTINGSILYVLQLLIDPSSVHNKVSFSILAEVPLDSQTCFIRCLIPSSHVPVPICIIGTYKPSIKFFLLNQPENWLKLVHEEFLDDIMMTKVNIPESILIIGDNEKAYFLAGLREGAITCYEWIWSTVENKPLLSSSQCRRIGTYPVKFIVPNKNQPLTICNVNDSTSILALSDRPWQIKYSHRTGLDFICVAFKHYEHVQEAVYFRYANLTQTYMFVSNDCLNFVKLNDFIKNNMRTIITPRRLFYDDLNNLLLVSCVSSSEPFPTSVLKLVDPINGVIFDEYFLRSEENYESDIQWRFTNERQDFRCICIGTGFHRGVDNAVRPTPPHRGRLLIFIIKKSLDDYGVSRLKYQLKLITYTEVDDPVHSISANTLNLLRFNLEMKKLILIYNKSHRWPILSVSACGTRISVGATHGFYFYEFEVDKERFRFLKSERTSRLINDTMMLNENLAVGCDKDGDVYGLMYDAVIVGCSLLGSVFLFMRIGIKTYDLLLVLQSILEKWPTTRPCLGNDNRNFRTNNRRQSLNLVIDGEMVSQFLRLTRTEQFKIVNNNPKLINAGTIFLRGEQIESEESRINQIKQQQITADHLEYRGSGDDEPEEEGFPELLDFPEEEEEIIRNKIIEKNLVSTEEIVDSIQSLLSELNMQVS